MRIFIMLAIALLSLLISGCGGAKTGTVTGTIKLNGKEVTAGTISFVPADPKAGKTVTAVIEADGTYKAEGVAYGDLLISLQDPAYMGKQQEKQKEESGAAGAAGRPIVRSAPEKHEPVIPVKFSDAASSGLKFKLNKADDAYNVVIP